MKNLEQAVRTDLNRLDAADRESALAELALILARALDRGTPGLRDTAAVARELRMILRTLADQRPEPAGELDEFVKKLARPLTETDICDLAAIGR